MHTAQLGLWGDEAARPPQLPREWLLFRWHVDTPPGRPHLGTPEFAALILENVETAAITYEHRTGHQPDAVIIQTPTRILGRDYHLREDGTCGTLGPYRVLMDPRLMFNEFGLCRLQRKKRSPATDRPDST